MALLASYLLATGLAGCGDVAGSVDLELENLKLVKQHNKGLGLEQPEGILPGSSAAAADTASDAYALGKGYAMLASGYGTARGAYSTAASSTSAAGAGSTGVGA